MLRQLAPKTCFRSRFRSRQQSTFASLSDKDVTYFSSILDPRSVVNDADALRGYNCDWTGEFRGASKLALLPRNTQQVSLILKHCFERGLAVVPQGGNTGLVGGSVPVNDEIILSLKGLNEIHDFDDKIGSITCGSGVTLQTADEFCRSRGFLMPLDLGSKGSCQLGGNLSTNAGGIRLIKYGSLRGNVLGLEVVMSDGTIIDSMRPLRKDNVGYDLKQVFVGSEGTLGIITKCAMLTPASPTSSDVALLAVDSYGAAMTTLVRCKEKLGSDLSAFEYFDRSSSELVEKYEKLKNPLFDHDSPFFLVMEVCGHSIQYTQDRLTSVLESLINDGVVQDAVLAQSKRQYSDFWGLRERITSSLRSSGMRVFKYDVSLPVAVLHETTAFVADAIRRDGLTDVQVFEYGHLGDGNLHFNAATPSKDQGHVNHIRQRIEEHLYSFVKQHRGSISAEHGLGQLKASKILYSRSPSEVALMSSIKRSFDPKGILNPYKVLV